MVGFIRFAALAAFGVFYVGLKIRRKNDHKNNLKEYVNQARPRRGRW